jgi:hypothetical protein
LLRRARKQRSHRKHEPLDKPFHTIALNDDAGAGGRVLSVASGVLVGGLENALPPRAVGFGAN